MFRLTDDTAVYGALNTGNAGTLGRYGQFCVVLDPADETSDQVVVIPHNSLGDVGRPGGFVTADAVVDTLALEEHASTWRGRADLVVQHRGEESRTCAEPAWPDLICEPEGRVLETISPAQPISSVREVRLRDEYRRELVRKERAVRRAEQVGTDNPLERSDTWELRGLLALERSSIPMTALV